MRDGVLDIQGRICLQHRDDCHFFLFFFIDRYMEKKAIMYSTYWKTKNENLKSTLHPKLARLHSCFFSRISGNRCI